MQLGIIARADATGLGNQTKRLTYMLNPSRLLVIDSTSFGKNKQQNLHWYADYKGYLVKGFPNNTEIRTFLKGLTHVLCAETPYNLHLYTMAKLMGIKTFCQPNYEFLDSLREPDLPLPDKFLMPSHWHYQDMVQKFPNRVQYLPPPVDAAEFAEARAINLARTGKRRFLAIVGTLAAHDRNGTLSVLDAIKFSNSTADYELVVRSQHELPPEYLREDPRIKYEIGNLANPADLYRDFDALILPRRYGGLCLPMIEAMTAGLPVIMTDISPNNAVLPPQWLVKAAKTDQFMARVPIDVYSADLNELARRIDHFATMPLETIPDVRPGLLTEKANALTLAKDYSFENLRPHYEAAFNG